jgi:hypothetical protein
MGMIRFSFLGAAWLALAGLTAPSQTVRQIVPSAPPPPRSVVPRQAATPFPPDAWTPVSSASVELRPDGQMTAEDRALEARAEAAIAAQAAVNGMDFASGRWSYRQIVCSTFPGHLFLRFTRDGGAGDVSVFSASIPRTGQGRVRVIPIQRRSYSLFSPAPVNAMTIAAFNHIRAEEQSMRAGGWVDLGFCYAALAGADPELARPERWSGDPRRYPAFSAAIGYQAGGGAILEFADISARPRPVEWTLVFDSKGALIKAGQRPAPAIGAGETHPQPAPGQARQAQ